ncbi:TetR/AcrR family transcriptional regulator [Novosphingobium fluoreni]|uniref:TetR/AcrR family transcriptional regulator n=1 Tax=Novosphingobium fluoreni TaxID=1391222 RepID=UPI003DA17D8F
MLIDRQAWHFDPGSRILGGMGLVSNSIGSEKKSAISPVDELPPYVSRRELTGKHTARRKQAIDTAAAIFARLGYQGASTRAIAEALGIKVASLYFHIASKEDALAEICLLGMQRSLDYLEEARRKTTLDEQIRHFFACQRDDLIHHADYVIVSIRDRDHLSDPAKNRIRDLTARFRITMDEMFVLAEARGELHPALTPRHGRFIMIGTLRGISEMYLSGVDLASNDIMDRWVETLIRGVVPEKSTGV